MRVAPSRTLAVACVAAVTLVHVWAARVLRLSVDEAHYALYGLHPDWSYYDHPPLVGWLQWLALRIGQSELVLRIWPLLGYVFVCALLWKLARNVAMDSKVPPERAGAIAVLLVAGMPAMHILGIGLVPELPLAVATLALVTPTLRVARDPRRLWDWLAIGVLLGLAGLSKYTAVLLPLSLALYMVWQRQWSWLLEPRAWLAGAVALAVVSPVFYWNSTHDWASFAYQWGHVQGQWTFGRWLLFVLAQIAVYSVIVTVATWRPVLAADTPLERLLVSLAAPVLVAGALSGGTADSLPHWTLVAWLLLVPLTASRLAAPDWGRWLKVGTIFSGALSIALSGALLAVLIARPIERFPITRAALESFIGWDQAAARAAALLGQYFPNDPTATLMVNNWTYASRLAWYARPTPVQLNDSRHSQFEFWLQSEPSGTIFVVPVSTDRPPNLKLEHAMDCRYIEELVTPSERVPVNTFRFYRCYLFDRTPGVTE